MSNNETGTRKEHPFTGMYRITAWGTIDMPRLPDVEPRTSEPERPGYSAAEIPRHPIEDGGQPDGA